MNTSGNTAVITGGASGIGLALAKVLLREKNTVIVLGRSAEKLEAAKREAPGLVTLSCDVTEEASLRAAMVKVVSEHPGFNLLVNAAGVSRACQFAQDDGAIAQARLEIGTNLLGTVMATKLALGHLLKRPEAAVVTISSGIALAPHLGEPTHSASKAALHAFCQCLRAQLAGSSVRIFEVLPPLTDTAGTKQVAGKKAQPASIAEAVLKGLRRDRYEIRIGIVNLLGLLVRLSPALAARIVTSSAPTPAALPPG